jgi:hypothetical protein
MFVTKYTTRVEVPGEDGSWVEIRPLSWLELERAQNKAVREAMQAASSLDVSSLLADASDEDIAAIRARVESDVLSSVDILEVLNGGIVAWSAEEPVDDAHVKLLEPEVAEFLAREIMGIRTKADLGNSSPPSTAS